MADARGRIRARLLEWDADDELRDDAGLVITELFTNAVRHTDSARITCALHDTGTVVRLEVTDQGRGTGVPVPCDAEADEEGGRGLLLVSVLSLAWGSDPAEDGTGRVVWAELARTTARAPARSAARTPAPRTAGTPRTADAVPAPRPTPR